MYLIILILQEHYEGDIKGEDLKNLDNALELDLLESTKVSQNLPESLRIFQISECKLYLIILILQEHYEGDIKGEDLKNLDNALELDLLESTKISNNIPESPRISQNLLEYSRSQKSKFM